MSVRRKFILLLSTAGCGLAFAFAMTSQAPGLGRIESAAPPYFDALARGKPSADDDGAMLELRQQASLALAQLQVRAGSN